MMLMRGSAVVLVILAAACGGGGNSTPTTPIAPSPSPATPTPGKTVAAVSGQVISNLTLSSGSGPCISVQGVTDVWIDHAQIGPCGAQGILLVNAAHIRITNSVIHTDHGGTA